MKIISMIAIGSPRGATIILNRFLAFKDLKKAAPGGNTLPKVYIVALERLCRLFDEKFRSDHRQNASNYNGTKINMCLH
jgi:hypothetical protein